MIGKKLFFVALALLIGLLVSCDKQADAPKQGDHQETLVAEVKSLSLSETERTLVPNEVFTLVPTILPESLNSAPLVWNSNAPEVAIVSSKGEVKALTAGEATISVWVKTQPKLEATCLVRVAVSGEEGGSSDTPKSNEDNTSAESPNPPKDDSNGTPDNEPDIPKEEPKKPEEPQTIFVERIHLDHTERSLEVGERYTLVVKIEPETATNKTIQWTSDRPEIASVSARGEVVAYTSGTAIIVATSEDGGYRAECRIYVRATASAPPAEPHVSVLAVSVELEPKELQVGRELQMREVIIPANATDKRVTWHLSNPEVATISKTGLIKAHKTGSTRITVRSVDGAREWTSREMYITPFQLGIGDKYPDLEGVTTHSETTTLGQLIGEGHYALLDFWGDWCYYCKRDMPRIKAIWEKYKGHGLRVIGVSSGDRLATHQRSVQDLSITWPQIIHPKDPWAFQRTYGITGFPHVLLLNRTGQIVAWKIGPREAENMIQEILDREGSL